MMKDEALMVHEPRAFALPEEKISNSGECQSCQTLKINI